MTSPSSLIEALGKLADNRDRCRLGRLLDTLPPAEQDAILQTCAVKVEAGRGGTTWTTIAKIISEETGTRLSEDDLRHHAKKECRCG